MATNYSQIGYGSSGKDVKTLQEMLNSNGYQLDVDGNFGPKTQAAVKDYQKKNNLTVDGIVGNHTWGSLTSGNTASTTGTASNNTPAPESDNNTGYTPSDTVLQAEALLQQHTANKPGAYESQYGGQIQDMVDQILNRDKFSYDLNRDALYQQYAEQYARMGNLAMMDTMGQAAAMTGGFGNSFAQTVGQQTYQGYMQQLNDRVPELYQLAADQYAREGEDMLNQYGLLVSQDEQAYGRYRDEVSDYYTELDRLTEDARYKAEDEYGKWIDDRNYDYQVGRDEVADEQWERSFNYQKERDSVADQQWKTEFDEAVRQYNESKKSSSGGGTASSSQYTMSNDEWDYWNNQWAMVETEADAEFLAESMEAAGIPFELIAPWYKKYVGGYEKDNDQQDTTVGHTVKLPKGGGGGRLGGGPAHVKQ